jgi:hypothetical protein
MLIKMFKPLNFVKRKWHNITYLPKEKIIWPLQRAKRGYSDCDGWNWGPHVIEMSLPILKSYRKASAWCPGSLCKVNYKTGKTTSGLKKWNAILDDIIEGFELHEKLENIDSPLFNPKTSKQYYKRGGQYEKDQKKIQKACDLFGKWLLALWD